MALARFPFGRVDGRRDDLSVTLVVPAGAVQDAWWFRDDARAVLKRRQEPTRDTTNGSFRVLNGTYRM
jgi:hypothetical protein